MDTTIRLTVDARKLHKLRADARRVAGQVVRHTAYDIVGRAQAAMSEPKTGRVYGIHQASAPGEPPAVDTGALKNSLAVVMDGDLTAVVSVGAAYGLYLELGTRRMAARPFLRPAVDAVKSAFRKAMRRVIGG